MEADLCTPRSRVTDGGLPLAEGALQGTSGERAVNARVDTVHQDVSTGITGNDQVAASVDGVEGIVPTCLDRCLDLDLAIDRFRCQRVYLAVQEGEAAIHRLQLGFPLKMGGLDGAIDRLCSGRAPHID